MARRWQYPTWAIQDTEGLTRPEETLVSKWWQPFSEPVRQHAGKLVYAAVIASGVAAIDLDALTRPEVTSLDKWWQPLSEPVRVEKPLPVAAYPSNWDDSDLLTRPEFTTLDTWYKPLLGIGFKKELRLSGPDSFPQPEIEEVPAEDITLDKWYSPFISIVQTEFLNHSGPAFLPIIDPIIPSEWYQPFSEPVRIKARASDFPAFTNDTEGLTLPEVIALDKWFSPLSEPVRVQPKSLAGLLSGAVYEGEPSDVEPLAKFMGWQPVLDSVSRGAVELAHLFAGLIPSYEEVLETTTLDKWYQPLAEPARPDARGNIYSPVLMGQPLTDFGIGSEVAPSLIALSEPLSIRQTQYQSISEVLIPPDITLFKWYSQFSQPLLVKEPVNVSFGEFRTERDLVEEEVITLDKWYKPHSEPVLVKPRASEFPSFVTDVEALTLPEVTSLDKWWRELSEPVRVQPSSLAGLLSGAIYEGEPTDVEPFAEFMGWFKGLDEPVLPRILPISNYPATFFEQEISELDPTAERLAWFVELSVPTLPKPRVAEFPAYVVDSDALTQPEVTSSDKWYRNLDEPVRVQPKSLAALVSGEVQIGEPSDIDPIAEQLGWYRDLDLPTLPKVRVAEFPAFIIDAELLTLPETTTLDKWWRELSEPVRVKARFLEALQLHVITDLTFDIAEIITLDKWYTPLDEPVRLGDRLVVPFRLPASVGREYQVAVIPVKKRISKEADQTHVSKEANQTHISKEADQTKDSKRC